MSPQREAMKYFATVGERTFEFRFERRDGRLRAVCGTRTRAVDLSPVGDGTAFSLLVDGHSHDLVVERAGATSIVQVGGDRLRVRVEDERERIARSVAVHRPAGARTLCAAMPGVVVDVRVREGEVVEDGQTLVVLEAMKMQNPMDADGRGRVTSVRVVQGEVVSGGAVLVEMGPP